MENHDCKMLGKEAVTDDVCKRLCRFHGTECHYIKNKAEPTERTRPDSDWWFKDLPHIDWEQEDGDLGTEFDMLRSSDDDYEWRQIADLYSDGSHTDRQAINQVFIHLCGWSLPTILEKVAERMG